ncbi:MAG: HEPN domain-containing protein [Clostridium sp.]|nr:HEPN domain-containing protein [Clostridium sp.]MCI7503086.1 HEPN domain-containing protein [Clostridium sp.]MDY4875127.1 HEPN domain-containing protein [Eubacterium sp.]
MDERRRDLCQYRIEQARESLKASKIMLDNKMVKDSINRSYYSAFYAMKAVLAIEEKDFKRHKDVVAYFNKMYVATGKFPKDLGRMIAKLQQLREKSDYDDFFVASIAKAEQQIMTAEKVITEVDYFIRNNDSKSK